MKIKPGQEAGDYTMEQVAANLQVCLSTVKRLIKKKVLRAFKVGRVVRISREALQRYKDENTIGGQPC